MVSRIEVQEYAQASAQLLAIQIDAAINAGPAPQCVLRSLFFASSVTSVRAAGNSGGPVVDDLGRVVGAAFQSLSREDAENIGAARKCTYVWMPLMYSDQEGGACCVLV